MAVDEKTRGQLENKPTWPVFVEDLTDATHKGVFDEAGRPTRFYST
jgi:hypothetical protein